jgi:hypothetical protein
MSVKSKVLATAATLSLLGGVGVAGVLGTAGAASAATPSCGPAFFTNCVDIFSHEYGHHRTPNFVVDVYQQHVKIGQKIILYRASNSDPAEDFTFAIQGTVSDFYDAGLVTPQLALHYGCIPLTGPNASAIGNFTTCPFGGFATDDFAFELEYAPNGVESGLCMGVASTAVQEEGVTLQNCGVSSKTVWVVDVLDSFNTALTGGYVPLINGSDTNFSLPFVLTYPASGYPTDMPRPQLQVDNLTGYSLPSGPFPFPGPELGTVDDGQLWGADFGILP